MVDGTGLLQILLTLLISRIGESIIILMPLERILFHGHLSFLGFSQLTQLGTIFDRKGRWSAGIIRYGLPKLSGDMRLLFG